MEMKYELKTVMGGAKEEVGREAGRGGGERRGGEGESRGVK